MSSSTSLCTWLISARFVMMGLGCGIIPPKIVQPKREKAAFGCSSEFVDEEMVCRALMRYA